MMERGREFFIMFLAHELRMTRRSLLASIDSYELSLWQAFFKVNSKPKEEKPNDMELMAKLQMALSTKAKKRK